MYSKYEEIFKKYVENMKKYVALGTRRAKVSRCIYLSPYIKALELEIIPSFPHVGSGTWKNCEPYPQYRSWDLGKRCESSYIPFFLYIGPEKNSKLSSI